MFSTVAAERTIAADGLFPAMRLGVDDDQGVKAVIERRIPWEMFFKIRLDRVIAVARRNRIARTKPVCVSVYDKRRKIESIQ